MIGAPGAGAAYNLGNSLRKIPKEIVLTLALAVASTTVPERGESKIVDNKIFRIRDDVAIHCEAPGVNCISYQDTNRDGAYDQATVHGVIFHSPLVYTRSITDEEANMLERLAQ